MTFNFSTTYGKRKYGERQTHGNPSDDSKPVATPRWVYFAWIVVVGLVLLFIAAHLMGEQFGAH